MGAETSPQNSRKGEREVWSLKTKEQERSKEKERVVEALFPKKKKEANASQKEEVPEKQKEEVPMTIDYDRGSR